MTGKSRIEPLDTPLQDQLKIDKVDKIVGRIADLKGICKKRDIADELDVPRMTFYTWLRKEHIPLDTLLKYSIENNINVYWLLFGDPFPVHLQEFISGYLGIDEKMKAFKEKIAVIQKQLQLAEALLENKSKENDLLRELRSAEAILKQLDEGVTE